MPSSAIPCVFWNDCSTAWCDGGCPVAWTLVASAVGERLIVSLRDTFNPGRGLHRARPRAGRAPFRGTCRQPTFAAVVGICDLQRRLALFRNGLVLIDGSACDMSKDEPPGEHHMQNKGPRGLLRLAKTADCLFLLESVPDEIGARRRLPATSHLSGAENWPARDGSIPQCRRDRREAIRRTGGV